MYQFYCNTGHTLFIFFSLVLLVITGGQAGLGGIIPPSNSFTNICLITKHTHIYTYIYIERESYIHAHSCNRARLLSKGKEHGKESKKHGVREKREMGNSRTDPVRRPSFFYCLFFFSHEVCRLPVRVVSVLVAYDFVVQLFQILCMDLTDKVGRQIWSYDQINIFCSWSNGRSTDTTLMKSNLSMALV